VTDGVRPRVGYLHRSNGETVELRFIETSEPGMFLAVTIDGEPVGPMPGDRANIDVLGPGQGVKFMMATDGTTSFTCPDCGATSHHPMDVNEGYCGRCHDWTGKPPHLGV
jgi:hypothetical protein